MRPLRKTLNKSSLVMQGIPSKFADMALTDFHANTDFLSEVKDFVTDYVAAIDDNFENNAGIFFNGSNGVGKTMLASIILKEAYRHRYTIRRCTFVEYVSQYTKEWSATASEKEMAEDRLYTYYKAVEFLALEEVGKEIDSKVSAPILEDLLRYREDKGLVTIICTNLTFADFTERYGASCASLLQGNLTPVTIESKDVRKKSFKARIKR